MDIVTRKYVENPVVSIIIPSLYFKERSKNIKNLMRDIENQTFKNLEVIFVVGDNRQGRAINTGAKKANGEILVVMDDDTQLGNNKVIENLYYALKEHPDYGLAGAACEIPRNASVFLKIALKQIPRRFFPAQEKDRESDMVQHPCLAIRRDLFYKIGGEDEELIRGLDPLLRYKIKKNGYKVVIVKDTWIYHLLPGRVFDILKMYYRNGKGAAFAQKFFPDKIYDVDEGFEENYIPQKTRFVVRILRSLFKIIKASLEGKCINLSVLLSYYTGYMVEYFFVRYKKE